MYNWAVINDLDKLYSVYTAKDARFDGRFFVGISSTKIYCRPVCRAKRPKKENCTFYRTAAEAEQNGYRPCLLCRPELAPGSAPADAKTSLVYRAARAFEKYSGSGESVERIAARLGYTGRHLRRVFTGEYAVSPVGYLQTCRLLLAKSLLTDTGMTVTDVAMTAGYGSVRRLNDAFKTRYGLSPTALRKNADGCKKPVGEITLYLGYRPPYRFDRILDFLAGRAIKGVESVDGGRYMRTVRLTDPRNNDVRGWVSVCNAPEKNALAVTVSGSLISVISAVLARIKHLFDLCCDPAAVYETLKEMNSIRPGLCVEGTRLPGCFNAFEMSVRAVLGQQITVKAASTLAARLAENFGSTVQTGIPGLTHTFPDPKDIISLGGGLESEFGKIGIIGARSRTIAALAKGIADNEIDFDCPDPESEIKKLTDIKGVGSWTAKYIAMRAMEWTDAFLETDYGVKKALAPLESKELLELSKAWRPWRSYATINLWNTLT